MIGQSFSPIQQNDPLLQRRGEADAQAGPQQAIQLLQLRMPRVFTNRPSPLFSGAPPAGFNLVDAARRLAMMMGLTNPALGPAQTIQPFSNSAPSPEFQYITGPRTDPFVVSPNAPSAPLLSEPPAQQAPPLLSQPQSGNASALLNMMRSKYQGNE